MATADLLEREEAPPVATAARKTKITKLDLKKLAAVREERYQARVDRHTADRNLDPRLRRDYLDREIVDTDWIAGFLGYSDASKGRVSVLRDGKVRIVPTSLAMAMGMTTAVLPGFDVSLGVAYGRHRPGTEKGRIIEWALKTHRVLWDAATGTYTPNLMIRQGRPRHARPTLGPEWDADPDMRRQLRDPDPDVRRAAKARRAAPAD